MNEESGPALHLCYVYGDASRFAAVGQALAACAQPVALVSAGSLAQAREMWRHGAPVDAVLADLQLTDGNGMELAQALPATAPLILLIPAGMEHVAMQAVRAGIHDLFVVDAAGGYLALLTALLPGLIARHKASSQLRVDKLYLDHLMEHATDSIYFKDRACRLLRVNRKMARDLGQDNPAALVGKTDIELFGAEFGRRTFEDDNQVTATGKPLIGKVESRALPDGHLNWTSTSKLPLRDQNGEIYGLMGITREINELKQAEFDLQILATRDPLTDLPNRYLLSDRLDQMVMRSARYHHGFAVLFLDLDDFKQINDTYGHKAGDRVLAGVARRLAQCVREGDTVARFAGDEFVVLAEGVNHPHEAEKVASKILAGLTEPLSLDDKTVQVGASIGICLFPSDARDADELLHAADSAMYEAKRSGKNSCRLFGQSAPGS